MNYYSLNGQSPAVDFREATIQGQAPDKGLYFPERIPMLHCPFLKNISQYTNEEIAFHVMRPYVGNTIPDEKFYQIVSEAVNFSLPLIQVNDRIASLELFHGPTLAFKDIGARFMSRCLGYFAGRRSEKLTVLVATSGDTGGAVANGFYDVPGVEVVILYPSGRVSAVQEKQLTTLGKNIHALRIEGTFDDCQQMVKQAFSDELLRKKLFLTSANSINVARWLPQQFYYFFLYKQWQDKQNLPVIAVPSGNFGNICAGLLAHRSGLPVQHFIAACNANNVVTDYLSSGQYISRKAVPTISNAMDVGDPSNFIRILELFDRKFNALKNVLSSYSISDQQTKETMQRVHTTYGYLLDPHGAVAYAALEKYLHEDSSHKGVFLETAHPVKFYDIVQGATGEEVAMPEGIKGLIQKEQYSIPFPADYEALKAFLLEGRKL